jgi:hypothetical protein
MTVSAHLSVGCPDPLIREQRHTGFEPDLLRFHRREILLTDSTAAVGIPALGIPVADIAVVVDIAAGVVS